MLKRIIAFILGLVFLNILRLTFVAEDIFKLLIVLVLYLIFISSMSHIKCENKASFMNNFLGILIISFIYFIVCLIISNLLFTNLKLLFILMGISIFIIPSLNIIKNCLSRKRERLINLALYIILFISVVISILLYHFSNLDINIVGGIVYLSMYAIFIPILILNRKLISKKDFDIKKISLVVSKNIRYSLIKLSNLLFYYLSIVILYFSLTDVFLFYDKSVTKILIDVYLYYFYIVIAISFVYYPKTIDGDINNIYIDLLRKTIPKLILLSFLAGPILLIIFGSSYNAYLFSLLIFESLFIIMYNVALHKLIKTKKFNIILCLGIVLKCILIVPMINSFYRMGYSMIYGDIVSTIISLFVVVLITIIYFNKLQKIDFSKYFGRILNIIYENVILCLILILLQFIIPLKAFNGIHALGIVIVYTVVFMIYEKIKERIKEKK